MSRFEIESEFIELTPDNASLGSSAAPGTGTAASMVSCTYDAAVGWTVVVNSLNLCITTSTILTWLYEPATFFNDWATSHGSYDKQAIEVVLRDITINNSNARNVGPCVAWHRDASPGGLTEEFGWGGVVSSNDGANISSIRPDYTSTTVQAIGASPDPLFLRSLLTVSQYDAVDKIVGLGTHYISDRYLCPLGGGGISFGAGATRGQERFGVGIYVNDNLNNGGTHTVTFRAFARRISLL